MTELIRHLAAMNAARQNAVNFVLLAVTLVLVMYFGLTGLEQAEAMMAV